MEMLLQGRDFGAKFFQTAEGNFTYIIVFTSQRIVVLKTSNNRTQSEYLAGHMKANNILFSSGASLKGHELTVMDNVQAAKRVSNTKEHNDLIDFA